MNHADALRRRARPYRLIAAWAIGVGLYLLGIGLLQGLPDARHNTAFSTFIVGYTTNIYWSELGVEGVDNWNHKVAGTSWGFLVFATWLTRAICIIAAVVLVVLRKRWPLVALVLAFQLAIEVSGTIERRQGDQTVDVSTIPASAVAEAERYSFAPPAASGIAEHNLKTEFMAENCANAMVTGRGEENEGGWATICSSRRVKARVHYDLMQYGYLTGDPAMARRHLEAIDRNDMTRSNTAEWRTAVIREWLTAKGYAPSRSSYKAPLAATAPELRAVAWTALAAGIVMVATGTALAALYVVMRRRIQRLNVLSGQLAAIAG